jgi:hypothetical protein
MWREALLAQAPPWAQILLSAQMLLQAQTSLRAVVVLPFIPSH